MENSVTNETTNTILPGTDELFASFSATLSEYTSEDSARIQNAWNFLCAEVSEKPPAKKTAPSEPPYMHSLRTAAILVESKLDADTIITGLINDLLEMFPDKIAYYSAYIGEEFGFPVLRLVSGMAKISSLNMQSKTLQQAAAIRKMLFAMVDDVRMILVELAEKLDRMRNLQFENPDDRKPLAVEAIDIWAPLAHRLGMSAFKIEFEDLSLKITQPDVYTYLKSIVPFKKDERAEYLVQVEKRIAAATEKAHIEVSISSRAKHFYSIYRKMQKHGKTTDDLYDLLAVRLVCHTVAECYALVGLVHTLWKPVEGRFKDYIAVPKPNGYQSLHTTVLCEGAPLEIQIRTEEMHQIAEYGIASHWLYKQGTDRDISDIKHLAIINRLRELKDEYLQDEQAFSEIRDNLLGDSIFVFTPRGEVIEMPSGATAIDFAYAIHSAIGETITGAKADGQIIPLSRPLENTQTIEILTSSRAHPTVNQLINVKTAKARSKIKAWLLQYDETFVEHLSPQPPVESILKPEVVRPRKKPRKASRPDEAALHADSSKIRIGNTTNFMVEKAKCCSPHYGDAIIGFVSRGRGIILHKANCKMLARIPNCAERTLAVEWADTAN